VLKNAQRRISSRMYPCNHRLPVWVEPGVQPPSSRCAGVHHEQVESSHLRLLEVPPHGVALHGNLVASLSLSPTPVSPHKGKKKNVKRQLPEGGYLYQWPMFLVLVVQPVGHLVTWNHGVNKRVIARIDVNGCTGNREAPPPPTAFPPSH